MDDLRVPNARVHVRPVHPRTGAVVAGSKRQTLTGRLTVTPLDLTFEYRQLLRSRLIRVWRDDIQSVLWTWHPMLFLGRSGLRFSTAEQQLDFRLPQWAQVKAARELLTTDIRRHLPFR